MRSLIAAMLLWAVPAWAHGPAEWIQQGQHKNAAGELCCGERDCFEINPDDVKPVDGGYLIKSTN